MWIRQRVTEDGGFGCWLQWELNPLEMTFNYLLHIGKLRQGVSIINGGDVSMSGTHQEHAISTLHIGHPTGNQTPGGQAPAPVLTEGSRVDQSQPLHQLLPPVPVLLEFLS